MDGIDLAVWSGGYVDVMEQKGREREEEGSSLFACGIKSLSEKFVLSTSIYLHVDHSHASPAPVDIVLRKTTNYLGGVLCICMILWRMEMMLL